MRLLFWPLAIILTALILYKPVAEATKKDPVEDLFEDLESEIPEDDPYQYMYKFTPWNNTDLYEKDSIYEL